MTTLITYKNILSTEIQKGRKKLLEEKRKKRIIEALSFDSGTIERPRKHIITKINNELEVYFLKPGKEVKRIKRPNPYDMTPMVGKRDIILAFDDIIGYISKISIIDIDIFKRFLIIIYRIGYMLDHIEVSKGIIRYKPCKEIIACIKEMDEEIGIFLPFNGLHNHPY